jgi:hypothetical protein
VTDSSPPSLLDRFPSLSNDTSVSIGEAPQWCQETVGLCPKLSTAIKARELTQHFANCLERVAVINETGIDRVRQAQADALGLFQTEGVIVSMSGFV